MATLDTSLDKREVTSDVEAMQRMIEWVEGGQWCRDWLTRADRERGTPVMCALGMVGEATSGSAYNTSTPRGERIKNALIATIGEDYPWDARKDQKINGGTVRGHSSKNGKIATYNNTRPTERDIAGWFRRALKKLQGT